MKKIEELYQERDAYDLDMSGNYFSKHMVAMTREKLHGKSDIACELGYRDLCIDELKAQASLITEAYNEVIEFTLKERDLDFLRCWQEGDWAAIHDEWPDFNLFTEAQINLMKESGFDPDLLIRKKDTRKPASDHLEGCRYHGVFPVSMCPCDCESDSTNQ